jgi:sarcosine oxidase gamma subunit
MDDVLDARSALGTLAGEASRAYGTRDRVEIAERRWARAIVARCDDADEVAQAWLAALIGIPPNGARGAVGDERRLALRLGPGYWLLLGSADFATPITQAPARVAVAEASDLWACVRVRGAHARDVLAMGSTPDFDVARMTPGGAGVTQLASRNSRASAR